MFDNVSQLLKLGVVTILFLSMSVSLYIKINTSSSEKFQNQIVTCHFEIFGKVQGYLVDHLKNMIFDFVFITGVWFRKYTADKATLLGLTGWCMNTPSGTVKGEIEGTKTMIEEM